MAIFRRKRSGKYTGNWIARIGSDEVNLGTKDKKEALRKLKEIQARTVAGTVAAAMDDVAGDEPQASIPPLAEGGESAGAQTPAPPVVPSGKPPASEEPADAGGTGDASAADINAAAADAAGPLDEEMAGAIGVTSDELAEAARDFANDLPDLAAGAWLKLQGAAVVVGHYFAKGKREGTRLRVQSIAKEEPCRKVLAVAAKMTFARFDFGLDKVPWWIVPIIGIGWTVQHQVANADVVKVATPTATPAAPAPSVGA